jgi:acid phosphatase (class A)
METLVRNFLMVTALAGCTVFGLSVRADSTLTNPILTGSTHDRPLHTVYLTGDEKIWSDFPKAPALGSPVDESDLLITLSMQATRTEAQKAEAYRDKHYSIKLVSDLIDPSFETKFPKTWAVLTQIDHEESRINSRIKKANARRRPFVQHPVLVTPLFTVPDDSYPSGHASGMELQARLLGQLFPSQADALLHRAREVADSRVVAGVHYASDTEYGLALGDLIFQQLQADPKFQSDLEQAAHEDKISVK